MTSEKQDFHTLNGMRGFAALVVLVYHTSQVLKLPYLEGSYLAVDVFFALSGFVLAHAYGRKFDAGMTFVDFMKVRFVRLYPLYLLGTLLGIVTLGQALLIQKGPVVASVMFGAALAGLPGSAPWYAKGMLYVFDPPAWSLFFEMCANVMLVLVWSRLSVARLGLMLALGAFGVVAASYFSASLNGGSQWGLFWVGAARVCFSFFVGVALYKWRPHVPRLPVVAVISSMLLIFWIPIASEWRPLYDALAVVIGIPVLIAFGTATEPSGHTARLFGFAGVTSYAIYMIHYPLLGVLKPFVRTFEFIPAMAVEAVFICIVVALAWLTDRYYDGPVRRLLTRRFNSPRPLPLGHAA